MSLASNTYLKSLIDTGSDAMRNLYLVEFFGKSIEDIAEEVLKVRNQDFTPPSFTQTTATKSYLTVDVDVPVAEITGEKAFSLTFRLDSNYSVYKYLLEQQAATLSGNEGWAINEVPDSDTSYGFSVRVRAFDRSIKGAAADPNNYEEYSVLYEFRHCWIKSLTGFSYTYNSNTPLTIKADIGFMDYDDPMNLLLKEES